MHMAVTPHYSHFVALLFLLSAFIVFVCLVIAAVATVRNARRLAKFAVRGAAIAGIGYAALLLGVALASPNKTLPPGKWKYFCEADCHIAYSIDSSQDASTLGPEAKPITAQGRFVVVRLKTWFDENSVASFRGNAPLAPNPRAVKLVDERGHSYLPVPQAAAVAGLRSTPPSQPLRPGESYLTTFVFDVPGDARNPKLLIADTDPMSSLVVDHENSPLHGKIYLSLYPYAPGTPAVQ
jgi:hypothetical protein